MDRKFYAFSGVPYAKPPIGNLRFQRPEAAVPWSGVLEATTDVECLQLDPTGTGKWNPHTEDCLVLNVYTSDPGASRPVMVFIHGGGFMMCSGAKHFLGPHRFMDRDIVRSAVSCTGSSCSRGLCWHRSW